MNKILLNTFMLGCQFIFKIFPKYKVNKDMADNIFEIYEKGAHVFRGYYDIDFFNKERNKFLVHILSENDENGNNISIGYFDINLKRLVKVCESNAWCWQQGSRLRWFDDKDILFNDCVGNQYISRVVDVQSKNTIKTFSRPLYDVCLEKEYGLSLNFSRLQRIRPGYGYRTLKDKTIGKIASSDDGIYRLDLRTDKSELIIPLKNLHSVVQPELTGEDYINHICISPMGDKFMFFYIVCDTDSSKTKVYLMCANADGSGIALLESCVQPSHYTWLDNEHLVITYWDYTDGSKQGYRMYDIGSREWTDYGENILTLDGHPTFINDSVVISDTYPKSRKLNNQYLYIYDNDIKKSKIIGRFFQDIRYSGEQRCDLHPSLSGHSVSVDTNCFGSRRVVLMDLHC